jgi:hypothetical protein
VVLPNIFLVTRAKFAGVSEGSETITKIKLYLKITTVHHFVGLVRVTFIGVFR